MGKALHRKKTSLDSHLQGGSIAGCRPLASSAGYQIYFCKLFGSFNQFDNAVYRWVHFKKSKSLL